MTMQRRYAQGLFITSAAIAAAYCDLLMTEKTHGAYRQGTMKGYSSPQQRWQQPFWCAEWHPGTGHSSASPSCTCQLRTSTLLPPSVQRSALSPVSTKRIARIISTWQKERIRDMTHNYAIVWFTFWTDLSKTYTDQWHTNMLSLNDRSELQHHVYKAGPIAWNNKNHTYGHMAHE